MLWGNEACAPQLLSLRSRVWELQLLSPHAATTKARVPRAHALQQEKPVQWEPQQSSPNSSQLERLARAATKTQHSQK